MKMRKRKWLFSVVSLCLLLPCTALAQTQYVSWESEPEEGGAVEAGETIRYAFTLEEAAQAASWAALRVQLGNGLELQPESISVVLGQQPAQTVAPEETPQDDREPEKTADAAQQIEEAKWEVVPGNDGFVLLLSSIRTGDTVSFSATVLDAGNVSAAVRADAFTSAISHTLVVPPTPAPAASASPVPDVAKNTPPGVLHIVLAAVIAVVLGLIGTIAYRRFVRPGVRSGGAEEACEKEAEENVKLPESEEDQNMQT